MSAEPFAITGPTVYSSDKQLGMGVLMPELLGALPVTSTYINQPGGLVGEYHFNAAKLMTSHKHTLLNRRT